MFFGVCVDVPVRMGGGGGGVVYRLYNTAWRVTERE